MPAIKPFFGKTLTADFHAAIMIFIVALPLYLGIAVACGAPVFAGIISGVVGGIVAALLGGSAVGVSGPSAGLASIMILAISTLGFEHFLVVVAISDLLQVIFGYLNLGTLGYYFPAASIRGMIASIGIILIMKQLPYFIGLGEHHFAHFSFHNHDGSNTFSLLVEAADMFTPACLFIGLFSLFLLGFLKLPSIKKTWLGAVPAYLIVLVSSILINQGLALYFPGHELGGKQLVNLPDLFVGGNWRHPFTFPDFSHLGNPYLFRTALALALISSLEALLVVEAAYKMDPLMRSVNLNRELKGQGAANFITGLIGGIPITQVIVLNAANINSGGQTRMASVFHGLILLSCWLFLPGLLNLIPLSALAAILIALGYQLTSFAIFKEIFRQGWSQFLPFLITIIVILFTDILTGVIIGILAGFFFLVRDQNKIAFEKSYDEASLDISDTGADPETALRQLKELSGSGIRFFIGPYSSADAAAVLDYANQQGITLLSPSSVAGSLAIADDNLFRLVPSDGNQAEAITALFGHDSIETVIPIVRDDVWGDGLIDDVGQLLEQQGKTVASPILYDPSDVNGSEIAAQVAAAISEALQQSPASRVAVYLLSFGEGTSILSAAAQQPECAQVRWYGSSAFANNSSLLEGPAAAAFALGQSFRCPSFAPDPAAEDLWGPINRQLADQLGRSPEVFALTTYDAVWLIAQAYRDCPEPSNTQSFNTSLRKVAENYYGITGRLTFDAAGDRKFASFNFWGLSQEGGAFTWDTFGSYDNASGRLNVR